jgi:hypothetical protein
LKISIFVTLRKEVPVWFQTGNELARDIKFGGQHIKRGDKLAIWYPSANRDGDVFEELLVAMKGKHAEPANEIRFIRSNRHQGVAEMRICARNA